MNIFVLNCGSSSLKFQLFEMPSEKILIKGVLEILGGEKYSLKTINHQGYESFQSIRCIEKRTAFEKVFNLLIDSSIDSKDTKPSINVIAHRLVNGGVRFSKSITIDEDMINWMEKDIELAPLHYPANIQGIKISMELMPEARQVGVFDTAFHASIPPKAYLYALPYEFYEKYSIRRFGFHGSSHRYVSMRASEILNKDYNSLKIISCHLGSGVSVAAIKNGKSVDTSMGMTPVEGLMMGTRVGDIDAGALLYLMEKENLSVSGIRELINKKSGFLGVSGISSDYREVQRHAGKKNKRAQLALDMFYYRVKKYIGSYMAILGGVDVLIFTGGIGENDPAARNEICDGMECFGILLDEEINDKSIGMEAKINQPQKPVCVMVIPTNEELLIARDSYKVSKDKMIT